MTPTEYQILASRTEKTPRFIVAGDPAGERAHMEARLIHAAMGITTEAGELMDVFKKYFIYQKPIDYVGVEEEIGDLAWYLALACTALGVSFEHVLEKNIEKLRARYGDKFTEEAALNRDLAAERKVLEGTPPTQDEIKELCRKLYSLLADPQPGLSSWEGLRNDFGRQLHAALGKVL